MNVNHHTTRFARRFTRHFALRLAQYNYLHGYATPNFDKMVGNPSARQIQWDDDPALLKAWKDAETGFPFIDAIMTQLKETGWIHHLARHMVACFLTRGDLYLSWEEGAKVFEEVRRSTLSPVQFSCC